MQQFRKWVAVACQLWSHSSLRCRAISDDAPRMESCLFRVLLEENIVGMQVDDVRAMGTLLEEAMSEGENSNSGEGQPYLPL
jgi:hypothetical protein